MKLSRYAVRFEPIKIQILDAEDCRSLLQIVIGYERSPLPQSPYTVNEHREQAIRLSMLTEMRSASHSTLDQIKAGVFIELDNEDRYKAIYRICYVAYTDYASSGVSGNHRAGMRASRLMENLHFLHHHNLNRPETLYFKP